MHHSNLGDLYQRVPDETQGDGGLEGYSQAGIAYQMYADQGSKNTGEVTRKQKEKITEDLKKLETNKDFWKETLGVVTIKTWILVVPECHDKAVLKHAQVKMKELRTKKLPFLDPNAMAAIQTLKDFPQACNQLSREQSTLRIEVPVPAHDAVELRAQQEPVFASAIGRKIKEGTGETDEEKLKSWKMELLKHWVQYELLIDQLLKNYIPKANRLKEIVADETADIESVSMLGLDDPRLTIEGALSHLRTRLGSDFTRFDKNVNDAVVWGIVARWIGDCPLQFRRRTDGTA